MEETKSIRLAYYEADARMDAPTIASFFLEKASVATGWPLEGPWVGRREVRKVCEGWYTSWGTAHPTIRWDVEELAAIPVADDEVLSYWQWSMKSKDGRVAKIQGTALFKFKGQKIQRLITLWDSEKTNKTIQTLE